MFSGQNESAGYKKDTKQKFFRKEKWIYNSLSGAQFLIIVVSKFPAFCGSNLNTEKSGNASAPASHDNGGNASTSHTYREEWQCIHCYFTWQDWQCVLSSPVLLCHTKWMHCHSSHARQEWTHCHCSLYLDWNQKFPDKIGSILCEIENSLAGPQKMGKIDTTIIMNWAPEREL